MALSLRQLLGFVVLAGCCAAGRSNDNGSPPKPPERRAPAVRTCGFEVGDEQHPLTCPTDSHCIIQAILPETTSFYAGCCRDRGGGCDVPETCVAATKPVVPGAPTNSATLTCSGAQPSCITYTWSQAHMVSFACGTTGGVKPAELEPTRATTKITTTRKTSSFPTSVPPTTGGSTTNPPAATDSSNGDSNTPGLGVMYGFTQSQRVGVSVGCGLAVSVFGAGVSYCLWVYRKQRIKARTYSGIPQGAI